MSENVLTIENATMQFGGVVAVDNNFLPGGRKAWRWPPCR